MDKYAVVTDEEMLKTAAKKGQSCPKCNGSKVDYSGMVPHCPKCGTEPWEKKRASK